MKRPLPSIVGLVLLCCSGISGCSQTPYTYSEKDGYTIDYPAVGQDISGVFQDMLNREGDPKTNKNATNGPVTFRVLSAKVIKAGDVVPSRDWTSSSVLFLSHIEMSLPNGQTVECKDLEYLKGTWQNGRFTGLAVDSVFGGAYCYGNPPELTDLQPAFLQNLQNALIGRGPFVGAYISDACSIETLFWELRGHDLVHQQYDFRTWLQANQLAIAHTDLLFPGTGNNTPAAPSQPASPVAQTPVPQPAAPVREVFDRYRLFPAPGVCFIVPITDPAWLKYKNALFTPRFDQTWAALAPTMTRLQLEQRLHDSMAASLKQAQRKAQAEHGPYESRLAQAAYVAQQPGATQAEKDTYAQLSRRAEAELGPMTGHLMALKILTEAIQADIDAQQK